MNLKLRLTIVNFLQFFIWGSYLTSLGGYMFVTLHFQGEQIGKVLRYHQREISRSGMD